MSGKGSGRRPTQIEDKQFEDNWSRIFGNKPGYVPLTDHFNHLLKDDQLGFENGKETTKENN